MLRLPNKGISGSSDGIAPSTLLPVAFVLTGILSLCLGLVWLVFRPDLLTTYHYNQDIIALTHLLVIGWVVSVVAGATYQLVPVALETRLYSEALARWHFALHTIAVIGMVWTFHTWNLKHVAHFGSVLSLGIALFVYNLGRTLCRVHKRNVTAGAIAAALFWISVAVLAGLTVATGKYFNSLEPGATSTGLGAMVLGLLKSCATLTAHFDPISTMHAHAHLGSVGCFTVLIVGVSYKVIPMFTLSEVQSRRRAALSLVLLNLGLAGSFFAILLRSPWKLAFTGLSVLGLAFYALELAAILRNRKRQALDWGVKYFLIAIGLLVPVSLLALVLSWPALPLNGFTGQLENLYGFLAIVGFITLAIHGMLYKILPFLVWFRCYSRQVGRARVPALADLYNARLQAWGCGFYLAGLAVTSVGLMRGTELVTRVGCVCLALGLLTFVANCALMFCHWFEPRVEPFVPQPSPSPKFV
jgi:hypothetical protein